mmetsp:Transcript_41196/g.102487  ORF Transcript_41196/g.102487 Transcript_41196/m.102487 type:complete len:250 (+) Transcript_41196:743-1492(+)
MLRYVASGMLRMRVRNRSNFSALSMSSFGGAPVRWAAGRHSRRSANPVGRSPFSSCLDSLPATVFGWSQPASAGHHRESCGTDILFPLGQPRRQYLNACPLSIERMVRYGSKSPDRRRYCSTWPSRLPTSQSKAACRCSHLVWPGSSLRGSKSPRGRSGPFLPNMNLALLAFSSASPPNMRWSEPPHLNSLSLHPPMPWPRVSRKVTGAGSLLMRCSATAATSTSARHSSASVCGLKTHRRFVAFSLRM